MIFHDETERIRFSDQELYALNVNWSVAVNCDGPTSSLCVSRLSRVVRGREQPDKFLVQ